MTRNKTEIKKVLSEEQLDMFGLNNIHTIDIIENPSLDFNKGRDFIYVYYHNPITKKLLCREVPRMERYKK